MIDLTQDSDSDNEEMAIDDGIVNNPTNDSELVQVTRVKHFDLKARSQKSKNKKKIEELLVPVILFAKSIGLKPGGGGIIEFNKEDEADENSNFEVKIKKTSTNIIIKANPIKALKAKDLAYISDNKYSVFRKEINLKKMLPALYQIKHERKKANSFFEIIQTNKGIYLVFC